MLGQNNYKDNDYYDDDDDDYYYKAKLSDCFTFDLKYIF